MVKVQTGVLQHTIPLRPRAPSAAQLHQIAKTIRTRHCVGRQFQVASAHFQPRITLFGRMAGDGHPSVGRLFGVGGQVEWQTFAGADAERKRSPNVGRTVLDGVIGQQDGADRLRILNKNIFVLNSVPYIINVLNHSYRFGFVKVQTMIGTQAEPTANPLFALVLIAIRLAALTPQVATVQRRRGRVNRFRRNVPGCARHF